MALDLKPAYLVHGEDHGGVGERRARLKALVEREEGSASVEQLEGEAATPAGVALSLSAMTFALGRRVILVEGVERWKEKDVLEHLSPAMGAFGQESTLALFAKEDAKNRAPDALHQAVKKAGGQVIEQASVKSWELPKWVVEQALRLGLELDISCAKALISHVGERQQRLLRELEKLALELGEPGERTVVGIEEIESRAARSFTAKAYTLADLLLSGDNAGAVRSYLALRAQGERFAGLSYLLSGRLREALSVSLKLRSGESPSSVKRGLRMPSRAADRFISSAAKAEPEALMASMCKLSDLEVDSRGGAIVSAFRSPYASLAEETLALRSIEEICELISPP